MLVSKIEFHFKDIQPLTINKKNVVKGIKQLISSELKILGNINIIFCSDDYLLKINEQYLNHDYYTDIITFDYVENSLISGDLFISVERVKENAVKFGESFIRELYRVMFHGILHLAGYSDKLDEEKAVMRDKENFYLDKVDFSVEEL
jgi:rRNA maturation RNase YbeY